MLYFQGEANQVKTCAWELLLNPDGRNEFEQSPTHWVGLPPSDFSCEGMCIHLRLEK